MDKLWNIAIAGVDGTIGRELVTILEERDFPVGELHLFASADPAGQTLEFRGEDLDVQELAESSFAGIDLVFVTPAAEDSGSLCTGAVAAGAVCIDCSGTWRMDPEVPLVVPEVNPDDIARFRNRGIVANPGSSTVQLVLPLKALNDFSPVRRVVVSTYQAVSENGPEAIDELRKQVGELLNGRPIETHAYPHQIAFNCLPHVDAFLEDGYTREERNLVEETRKIMGADEMGITATAVRVPVFYGSCESINIETAEKIAPEKARELFAAFPGLEVVDEPAGDIYPMPVETAGSDAVSVGRIRQDLSIENGLNLWTAADNVRKGAATNAVQIAELLVARYL